MKVVVRASPIIAASAALLLASAPGCGGEDGSTTEARDTQAAVATGSDAKRIDLVRCQVRSGGYDVHAAGILCEEVEDIIRHWGPAPVFGRDTPPEGVFRRGDWLCWSRLEHRDGKPFEEPSPVGAHILNVCSRGSDVIVSKFS